MAKRSLLIILGAFLVSVAVRVPQLDRPLSAHHEYCTAFTLIALTNWYEDGFATHHGVPSGGFVRQAEPLFPPDKFSRNERAIGTYYFSHPPLAYDLPYLLFSIFGTAPNVTGLQLFNLFFHLITTIALFFVLRSVFSESSVSPAPLFAALLYLFMPAPLWFHGNAYMSDLFVQNMWVLHLVFAIRVFQQKEAPSTSLLLRFGLTLFLTVYTSWLGVFAAATAVGIALWQWRTSTNRRTLLLLGVSVAAVVLTIGLSAFRYLQVVDASALIQHFTDRFAVRGSFAMPDGPLPHLKQMVINYRMGFLPVLIALGILLFVRVRRAHLFHEMNAPRLWLFVALTGIPVLLDHAFLLQYADHDFSALKAGPLLCGLSGIGISVFPKRWATVAIGATCLAGVLYFYKINPVGEKADERYAQEMELGSKIGKETSPDDVVFAIDLSAEPQVVWYAHRNIIRVGTIQQAEEFIRERGLQEGVVFQREGEGTDVHRIRPAN
ncbi:MAG: hypothetical protein KBA60_00110 [Flavobacteriales bacterium]|nr:hypothetical protein [Flavobacteriales bacterium]HQW39704.1 hypothetical protein [Flavobacteriales bacterium]